MYGIYYNIPTFAIEMHQRWLNLIGPLTLTVWDNNCQQQQKHTHIYIYIYKRRFNRSRCWWSMHIGMGTHWRINTANKHKTGCGLLLPQGLWQRKNDEQLFRDELWASIVILLVYRDCLFFQIILSILPAKCWDLSNFFGNWNAYSLNMNPGTKSLNFLPEELSR